MLFYVKMVDSNVHNWTG